MAQHAEIADGLAAVGEHHRHIDGDPTRLVHRPTLPQPHQGITESAGQPGHVSNIGQQTSTGMTDHAPTTTRDRNLRTRTGTLHLESAFRDGRMRP